MAEVEMHEECGVFGIQASPEQIEEFQKEGMNLVEYGYHGLQALQNRGRDCAGIAANYLGEISVVKGSGSIPESLPPEARANLPGDASIVISQTRYATSISDRPNVPGDPRQPFLLQTNQGVIAIGHNGNLVNDRALALQNGYTGRLLSDSWLVGALGKDEMNRGRSFVDAFQTVLPRLQGAFSIVATHGDQLIGARDPNGIRPLHIGRLATGYVLASETGALYNIGATEEREVEPGELVVIDQDGLHPYGLPKPTFAAACLSICILLALTRSLMVGRSARVG